MMLTEHESVASEDRASGVFAVASASNHHRNEAVWSDLHRKFVSRTNSSRSHTHACLHNYSNSLMTNCPCQGGGGGGGGDVYHRYPVGVF